MGKIKVLFIFTVLSCLHAAALCQGKWEIKKNEKGIAVYTRKPLTGNLKDIRVVCEFDASRAQLVQTLLDIKHYYLWVYSTKQNTVLKLVDANHIIYHSISHLPWPLKDRDLIIELNILPPIKNDAFQISAVSLPDYLPKDDNYIRVPYSQALWNITIENEHKLKVDYTLSVDPGGSVPSWLVNSTVAIGPYNSFLKLKEILEGPKHSSTN